MIINNYNKILIKYLILDFIFKINNNNKFFFLLNNN